ncbi:MAG: ribosome maturation factor RimP [Actinomycetaceae bacterium]
MTTASNDLAEQVRAAVAGAVEQAGLLIENVEVTGAGRRRTVSLVVDLPDGPGGVSSDQIGEVSREVSTALDEIDVIPGAYTLEVSTPGTDRPLTEPRHFRRAVGRLVTVTTAEGATTAYVDDVVDDTTLKLSRDGAEHEIALGDVVGARVEVELKRRDR